MPSKKKPIETKVQPETSGPLPVIAKSDETEPQPDFNPSVAYSNQPELKKPSTSPAISGRSPRENTESKSFSGDQPHHALQLPPQIEDEVKAMPRSRRKSFSGNSNGDGEHQPPAPYVNWARTNYYKYQNVKPKLIGLLKSGTFTTDFIAEEIGVAKGSTFHKYKAMAQLETGLLLMTKEERDYLETRLDPAEMAKMENQLDDQQSKKK